MRFVKKLLAVVAGLIVAVVAGGYLYLVIAPPDLLRVGAGYSAKITCSSTFVSGRDPSEVLAVDVQAPGNPILKAYTMMTDMSAGLVRSGFLRFVAATSAVDHAGLGCTLAPDGDTARAAAVTATPAPGPSASTAAWPQGEGVDLSGHDALAAVVGDDTLAGPGYRAIVVIKGGQVVAERYADGFGPATPILGWSMTKTVTAALVGTVVRAGDLRLDQADLMPQWAGDDRAKITVADLLGMSSGLQYNENYGDVSDVTRMLYLEPDMANFSADMPLTDAPGVAYNYSSGSPVILARIWQDAVGGGDVAANWPRTALFGPLGMDSAVMEMDEAGTFVGGSYMYATARDWARFGQFLLQDGIWNGQRLLPWGYVTMMQTPVATNANYGQGLTWLTGPGPDDFTEADSAYGVPADAYWLRGHDGQYVIVIPSADMVVVRMGLTPSSLNYRPQPLVAAVLTAQ